MRGGGCLGGIDHVNTVVAADERQLLAVVRPGGKSRRCTSITEHACAGADPLQRQLQPRAELRSGGRP